MKISDRALVLLEVVDSSTLKDWDSGKVSAPYCYLITEAGRLFLQQQGLL